MIGDAALNVNRNWDCFSFSVQVDSSLAIVQRNIQVGFAMARPHFEHFLDAEEEEILLFLVEHDVLHQDTFTLCGAEVVTNQTLLQIKNVTSLHFDIMHCR